MSEPGSESRSDVQADDEAERQEIADVQEELDARSDGEGLAEG
jgi:hypothetical protein